MPQILRLASVCALCVGCSASSNGSSNEPPSTSGTSGGPATTPPGGTSSGGAANMTSIGSSGSSATLGVGATGSGISVSRDAGTSGSGGVTGEGEACSTQGATRSCCAGQGTETCNVSAEFGTWGPCTSRIGIVWHACPTIGHEDAGKPPPPPPPPASPLCMDMSVNTEPEILAGYSPYPGQTVGANGQIKVWVDDENAPFVAPGEQADPTTGMITMPGDRTAKAPDGYLWEPALYIAPQTAASGGKPYFPSFIKGNYGNNPPTRTGGVTGAPVDPIPPGTPPPGMSTNFRPGRTQYHAEYIWDVASLGLAPGTYAAEFLIYDGDRDRGVGCVNIVIAP